MRDRTKDRFPVLLSEEDVAVLISFIDVHGLMVDPNNADLARIQSTLETFRDTRADYEGWRNQETWWIAQYINNDQGEQAMWLNIARQCAAFVDEDEAHPATRAAEIRLVDRLKAHFVECDDIDHIDPLYRQLVEDGLARVEWHQIAREMTAKMKEGV